MSETAANIHVMGISAGLPTGVEKILQSADVVFGSKRQLQYLPDLSCPCIKYPSPFSELKTLLTARTQQQVVLLASGDPLFHGIGQWLQQNFSNRRICYHPNLSSIQLAFNILGKSWTNAQIINLHGRPLALIRRYLKANRCFAVLTDENNHPQAIANELNSAGFNESTVYIGENLGTDQQQFEQYKNADLLRHGENFCQPNVVIIETKGQGGVLPEFPGIEDKLFISGEKDPGALLSKREVRLSILSLLQITAQETVWDIGAGCGGVAIECALWQPLAQVYAIENNPQRLGYLNQNRDRFGVIDNMQIIAGDAQRVLDDLPVPQAVFIGGHGGQLKNLLSMCWSQLGVNGRMLVSAVTENSRSILHEFAKGKSSKWSEISCTTEITIAKQRVLQPKFPVLLVKFTKTAR